MALQNGLTEYVRLELSKKDEGFPRANEGGFIREEKI